MKFSAVPVLLLGLALAAHAAAPAELQTPAGSLKAALADALRAGSQATYYRYLWLGNPATAEARAELIGASAFAVNSLSARRTIVGLAVVPEGGAGVLRIDLRAYGLSPAAWDDLGRRGSGAARSISKQDAGDYVYHVSVTQTVQEYKDELVDVAPFRGSNGQVYNQRWAKKPTGKTTTKTELAAAPWLDPVDAVALAAATDSEFPILRADWFISYALLAPAYYHFLGVRDEATFDKLVRYRVADDDLSVKGVALVSSLVALHNRSLVRGQSVIGFRWRSNDYASSIGNQDVLADPLDRDGQADAHEYIASLPNGLQAYLVTNKELKAIDFGDPNVVADLKRTTGWEDVKIWSAASCILCHTAGMRPFQDSVRSLADRGKKIFALVPEKDAARFGDLYGPDIDRVLAADQATYARAVRAATGWTAEQNAAAYGRIFLAYMQEPLTLEQASFETGYPAETLRSTLERGTGLNHTLTRLLAGGAVRRDQWEGGAYAQLMTLLQLQGTVAKQP